MFATPTVLLGCCRVTTQLPIGACLQHLYLLVIVTPPHHSCVLPGKCEGAEEQPNEGPENSAVGAQGTRGRSNSTSGDGEHNCDDEV